MVATAVANATGKVVQVTGAVVDIEFPPDQLPEIYNALTGTGPVPIEIAGALFERIKSFRVADGGA